MNDLKDQNKSVVDNLISSSVIESEKPASQHSAEDANVEKVKNPTDRILGKPPLAHKDSMTSNDANYPMPSRTQKSFRIHRTGKRVSTNQILQNNITNEE